jgi:hypothetical protein
MAVKGMLDSYWESIIWDIERLILDNTAGERKAGGADPLDYGDYSNTMSKSEGHGPLYEDYLWWDGYVDE